jgi:hypothetical protein
MGAKHAPAIERFHRFYTVSKITDCWEWKGFRDNEGYGRFGVTSRKYCRAHQYQYEINNGPVPKGMVIMHTCDNPPCVNPHHLKIGTHQENMADKVSKNRQAKGHKNGAAKLDEFQVKEIRTLYGTHLYTLHQLGEKYGVSYSTIWLIAKRKKWKHID